MPHDAHPMGVLVSAMSALSIFHPDANPALRVSSLSDSNMSRLFHSHTTVKEQTCKLNILCWVQGQDIYDSKQVRDKQIVRIIGKVPYSLLLTHSHFLLFILEMHTHIFGM